MQVHLGHVYPLVCGSKWIITGADATIRQVTRLQGVHRALCVGLRAWTRQSMWERSAAVGAWSSWSNSKRISGTSVVRVWVLGACEGWREADLSVGEDR